MRISEITEATKKPTEDVLWEAAWWVTRWISGSMTDPDWDDSWTTMSYEEAFRIVGQVVGHGLATGYPALWRVLSLSKAAAQRVIAGKMLPPNSKWAYQSFSGTKAEAEAFVDAGLHVPAGHVVVLVSAKPPASLVPFGMADLLRSRNKTIRDALRTIGDWHHQDEVLVHVTSPLPLISAATIRR